jgi:DNA-binding winged helix-turn-helix (wHTH) protein/tetratricopeptide (TPR) repeat protein
VAIWIIVRCIKQLRVALGVGLVGFAGFELDQQRGELRAADGATIKLRPKTFEMLRLFAANPSRVLGKQELMEAIWPNVHVGEDSLFQCIRELRGALGDDKRQIIKLASGGGYVFTASVTAEVSAEPTAAANVTAPIARSVNALPTTPATVAAPAKSPWPLFGPRRRTAAAAIAGFCAMIGLAIAAPIFGPGLLFKRTPPTIAVMPIVDASDKPGGDAMAAEITHQLSDGFAKIANITVVISPPSRSGDSPASTRSADFEMRGELQRDEQTWTLRARIIKTDTGEIKSVATASVDANEVDEQLLQTRLAAGVGHPLARRLNEILEAGASLPDANNGSSAGSTKVVIDQAVASIDHTTRERFGMAQTMLKKALADDPGNADIAVALASLQLRGIQMVWFKPDEAIAVEAQASATLERALRAKPNSVAVLETYCRFLSATNHFVESLVACAKILSLDPWNGGALYLVGLAQINLGRFEDALATFRQADRFDTPAVSRWTWLLGAGWANMLMERGSDALPWVQRSIAITPASGRSQMLLAAIYQKLGRFDEARAMMQAGLKLRPGTTALNIAPPTKNSSPVFLHADDQIIQLMVEAGLPDH